MGEVVLPLKEVDSNSEVLICRICHEEGGLESGKALEAPCACSGTVKFAHRDCLQRWCDEKGNTTCEICLQKFQSGYSAVPKKSQLVHTVVSIRESREGPGRERRAEERESVETNYPEISSAAGWSSKCCRKVALFVTVLVMLRHIHYTLSIGTEDYPFTLHTLIIIRVSGVVMPMYIIMKAITAVQNTIKRQHQEESVDAVLNSGYEDNERIIVNHHTIEIQS